MTRALHALGGKGMAGLRRVADVRALGGLYRFAELDNLVLARNWASSGSDKLLMLLYTSVAPEAVSDGLRSARCGAIRETKLASRS